VKKPLIGPLAAPAKREEKRVKIPKPAGEQAEAEPRYMKRFSFQREKSAAPFFFPSIASKAHFLIVFFAGVIDDWRQKKDTREAIHLRRVGFRVFLFILLR